MGVQIRLRTLIWKEARVLKLIARQVGYEHLEMNAKWEIIWPFFIFLNELRSENHFLLKILLCEMSSACPRLEAAWWNQSGQSRNSPVPG